VLVAEDVPCRNNAVVQQSTCTNQFLCVVVMGLQHSHLWPAVDVRQVSDTHLPPSGGKIGCIVNITSGIQFLFCFADDY